MITLATLPEATEQQVFDQCAKHLLTQKCKSLHSKSGCAYRGCNNTKCVAGCLISDSEYSREMEYNGWCKLVDLNFVPNCHFALIVWLQFIHDKTSVDDWPKSLTILAEEKELCISEEIQKLMSEFKCIEE